MAHSRMTGEVAQLEKKLAKIETRRLKAEYGLLKAVRRPPFDNMEVVG